MSDKPSLLTLLTYGLVAGSLLGISISLAKVANTLETIATTHKPQGETE